ncbi:hypothetical protein QJS10_CPA05g01423 [Acorus calamus]|uniref:Uncharacterized protein n=1 Tax=Acorus calamus TaxID=4465 RepID=A0AAV9ESD4_ACOCL|nr:hypothetical protein QJS10_CPA05g01423 [Acorus calamus]
MRGSDPDAAETAVAQPPPPSDSPSPRTCSRLGFFGGGGGSNPSTPRLRCRTTTSLPPPTPSEEFQDIPKLQCKTTAPAPATVNRSRCGVCMESVKSGRGKAIFTAECAHAFHFPCIAAHVKKNSSLVCPVCSNQWRDPPFLSLHKSLLSSSSSPPPPPQHDSASKSMPSTPTKSSYDDDEPLLSSTPSSRGPSRFNPIFEAEDEEDDEDDDDDEEEIEEFQGFFVNHSSSSSSSASSPRIRTDAAVNNTAGVGVRISSEAAIVSVGRSHETHIVALRVKAPSAKAVLSEPGGRAAIDLVTVLDVSGSMSGAKLHMLQRAMRLLIASLGPADRLSVVAFSTAAKRLLPLRRMLPAGQRARVLEDRRHRNPVASIVLLSDGQEEGGVRSSNSANNRSRPSSTRFAHLEIPVHASGFGKRGEPAEDAFARCVGGLLSVVAQDVRFQIGFAPGSAPGEITSVYACGGLPALVGGGSSAVRIGDLYAEEERELLLEMTVPRTGCGGGGLRLVSVRCCFRDPATQELLYCRDRSLVVPTARAVKSTDPKIERLRNLFVTTRATAESRRLVEHGEYATALQLLSSARALLKQSSSVSANESLRGLEAEMAEVQWKRQMTAAQRGTAATEEVVGGEGTEALTPTSAWRAAERLAKVAIMRKSMNRVSDLHGFENARF